jgi:small GTP-binding protein
MGTAHSTREIDLQPRGRCLVVGTAGHIDHGKTSLVYALTGIDTDRLPEEKRRKITVDLGFASLRLPDGHGGVLELSIVDVPGHYAFIRNMLAGAAGIDCVMLVIAADEGVMPQTEEHLAICSLLEISRGLVAITKADAVGAERMRELREEVRTYLGGTVLENSPVVPISVWTGEGIMALKSALVDVAQQIAPRTSDRIPRLPIDRAFSIRGFGTVVTGTLGSGEIRKGDVLIQQPQGRALHVRGIQVHQTARISVRAPSRVALNVTGAELCEISRGDTLVPPNTVPAVSAIDVVLTALPGSMLRRHRSRVRVHAFASEAIATVLLYGQSGPSTGESGLARLRLHSPLPSDNLLYSGHRRCIEHHAPSDRLRRRALTEDEAISRKYEQPLASKQLCDDRSQEPRFQAQPSRHLPGQRPTKARFKINGLHCGGRNMGVCCSKALSEHLPRLDSHNLRGHRDPLCLGDPLQYQIEQQRIQPGPRCQLSPVHRSCRRPTDQSRCFRAFYGGQNTALGWTICVPRRDY